MELYNKMKNGDPSAREEIIVRSYPIVLFCIKRKYMGTIHQLEEYKSHGTIGLMKAVDSYSLEKNTNFLTYAIRCIDNEIGMYIRKEKNKINTLTCSYYTSDDKTFSIVGLMCSDQNVEEEFVDRLQIEDLKQVVDALPERDKSIIMNYYGLNNCDTLTMVEVAEKIGISQSYISRLMPKIIKRLKTQMEALGYEGETYKRVKKG